MVAVRIREIKKGHFQAWVREILKKGKILHVFISIWFFPACLNCYA